MSNRSGKSYALTVLNPIKRRVFRVIPLTWYLRLIFLHIRLTHRSTIKRWFKKKPRLNEWALKLFKVVYWPSSRYQEYLWKLGFLHGGRWVIIDRFPHVDGQPRQRLRHPYLLFCSNFDGTWDQYINAFSEIVPGGLNLIYKPSVDFPMSAPYGPFTRWIRHNQLDADNYYCAYDQASTAQIRAAQRLGLALERLNRRWCRLARPLAKEGRKPDDAATAAFREAYQAMVDGLQQDPTPVALLSPAARVEKDRKWPWNLRDADEDAGDETAEGGLEDDEAAKAAGNGRPWLDFFLPSDRDGEAYGLTVISPIKEGCEGKVRAALADLRRLDPSPLSELDGVHFARWVVIDDVPQQSPSPLGGKRLAFAWKSFRAARPKPVREDHLTTKYLLFAADFDGDVNTFVSEACKHPVMRQVIDNIWTDCYGFPGVDSREGIVEYLEKCRVSTTFFFLDRPLPILRDPPTVKNIRGALIAQEMFTRFAMEVQRMDACVPGQAERNIRLFHYFGEFLRPLDMGLGEPNGGRNS